MRLHDICFLAAALAGLLGMSLGLAMGVARALDLAPAHAHLNLLGWVGMALVGLYYRGATSWRRRLAWTQVTLGVAGSWTFPLALGLYLWTGNEATVPLVVAGAVMAIASMALFAAVIVLDIRDRSAMSLRPVAESG